jgi:ATP-dependent Clp protease ATP-binding subunit ClpC
MFEMFTERARYALSHARQAALRLHRDYIDTEHLLLGIMREDGGIVIQVLASLGCSAAAVRSESEKLSSPPGSSANSPTQLPFSPACKRAIELAAKEKDQVGQGVIDTELLLIGLIEENTGIASRALTSLGLNLDNVRNAVRTVLSKAVKAPFYRSSEFS